jgi:hypothetical protein
MLDQPFLAARLVEAGVACAPLPFHKVNAQVSEFLMSWCTVLRLWCAAWRGQRAFVGFAPHMMCADVCVCPCVLQALVQRIQQVLGDGGMQARAAAVAAEVAAYGGVARAADIALSAVSPWEKE